MVYKFKKGIYIVLPIIFGCHCKSERSFFYRGEQFPICSRCTGELVGIIFSIIAMIFFTPLKIRYYFIIQIPMIIDGFIQLLTSYESNNTKRFITGFLFGYGLFSVFELSTIYAFKWGYVYGQEISKYLCK